MHEYSLIQSLLSRAEDEARRRGAIRVHALAIRVGDLSGVDPDLLTGAYELAREGTACAAAELRVTRVPAAWSCPRCRRAFTPGEVLRCAACAVPAALSDGADALTLDSIEMEVP
jgi:hydrogenase nickel incorporation protein HypA/HybF